MAFQKGYIPTTEHRAALGAAVRARVARLGYRYNPEQRAKWSESMKEKGLKPPVGWNKGIQATEESNAKRRAWNASHPEKLRYWKGRKQPAEAISRAVEKRSGDKHYKWKGDRSTLKKQNRHGDSAYKEWRKTVYRRDGFKCQMGIGGCSERMEVHHILSWAKHPALRYEVTNGITLCRTHHPRKVAEENRLVSFFQEKVKVSGEPIF